LKEDKVFGVCNDEASLVNALGIAVGISTYSLEFLKPKQASHNFVTYYDPKHSLWTSYEKQLDFWWVTPDNMIDFYIFKPPIILKNYPGHINNKDPLYGTSLYLDNNAFGLIARNIKVGLVQEMLQGISTSKVKNFVLYNFK
jgi:hypothetical protein